MRVAVCVDHDEAHRFVRQALRDGPRAPGAIHLTFLPSPHEIANRASDFELAVVDPLSRAEAMGTRRTLEALEDLASALNRDRVVLLTPADLRASGLLNDLMSSGFTFLVEHRVGKGPESLLRACARSRVRCRIRERTRLAGSHLRGEALSLLLDGMAGWPPTSTVLEQAKRVSTSSRNLRRKHARHDLPTPRFLLTRGRFLELCALMELGINQKGWLARMLGLRGRHTPARLCRICTGMPWSHFFGPDARGDASERVLSEILRATRPDAFQR